jgi:hypothetical protein
VNGYRVDVIGADGVLIRSITTDITTVELGELPEGARVIVYADRGDGLFEKIVEPREFKTKKPLLEQLVLNLPYMLAGLGILVIAGALTWKRIRKTEISAPETMPQQETPTGEEFMSHR